MSDKKDIKLSRLREVMRKSKMSNTEISKISGIDRTLIGRHCKGQRTISTADLITYCQTFNVSADYLLGLSDAPTTDKDLQSVCDYTGLDEIIIKFFAENKDINDRLVSIDFLKMFIYELIYRVDIDDLLTDFRETTTYLWLSYIGEFDERNGKDITIRDTAERINDTELFLSGMKFELNEYISDIVNEFSVSNIDDGNYNYSKYEKSRRDFYELFYQKRGVNNGKEENEKS